MFDIGWTELLIIAVLAIVVVGPRDLPRMMRTVGQFVSKMRGMAREFQSQFDQAVREAELDDVKKAITDVSSANPVSQIKNAVTKPLTDAVDEIKSSATEIEKAGKPDKPADAAADKPEQPEAEPKESAPEPQEAPAALPEPAAEAATGVNGSTSDSVAPTPAPELPPVADAEKEPVKTAASGG